jgi:hypothetical protein
VATTRVSSQKILESLKRSRVAMPLRVCVARKLFLMMNSARDVTQDELLCQICADAFCGSNCEVAEHEPNTSVRLGRTPGVESVEVRYPAFLHIPRQRHSCHFEKCSSFRGLPLTRTTSRAGLRIISPFVDQLMGFTARFRATDGSERNIENRAAGARLLDL